MNKEQNQSVVSGQLSVVGAQQEPVTARGMHVEVLNRNRVLSCLRMVARMLKFGQDELGEAQKIALEIGDVRLTSELLHAQNKVALAQLDLPDLGGMEAQIEHQRVQALLYPASVPERITSDFGAKMRAENLGGRANRREAKTVAA